MLFKNTLATSAGYISGYVLSFVLAPIMLARLGLEQFGVWAVTGAFASYAGLVDLGVTRSIEWFVARYHAHDDRPAVEQVLALGLLAVTAIGAFTGIAGLIAAPLLAGALDDVLTTGEMRIVLVCAAGTFAMTALRGVLAAIPRGMLQMVPPNVALVAFNVINFVISVTALVLSTSLVTYALANVAASVVGVVVTYLAMRHVAKGIRVRRPTRALVKDVVGFGLKSQVSWFAELVNFQADKVIIALVIDVRAAGAYEIASRAVSAVRSVGMMAFGAMGATAAAEIARGGRDTVRDFYRRYTARSLGVALPVLIVSAAAAPALLVAWLGEVPDDSLPLFVVLTLANAVNLTSGVASQLTLGEGKAGVLAWVATGTATANILLTLALTPLFDLWGVIGATVVSLVGATWAFLVWFHRSHGVPPAEYLRAAGAPLAAALAASAPVVLWLLAAGVTDGERVPAAIATAVFFVVFAAIYWPLATRLEILPERLRFPLVARAPDRAAGRSSPLPGSSP